MNTFRGELESLLNKYSQENGSDTPDFILATFLDSCLTSWNHAIAAREKWYGRNRQVVSAPESDHPPDPPVQS